MAGHVSALVLMDLVAVTMKTATREPPPVQRSTRAAFCRPSFFPAPDFFPVSHFRGLDRIEGGTDDLALPAGHTDLLGELKSRVRAARTRALRTVNTQLIDLY